MRAKRAWLGVACLFMACGVGAVTASADRITLRNGQTEEGIIIKETDGAVLLEVCQGGTMALLRRDIRQFERTSLNDHRRLKRQWALEHEQTKRIQQDRRLAAMRNAVRLEETADAAEPEEAPSLVDRVGQALSHWWTKEGRNHVSRTGNPAGGPTGRQRQRVAGQGGADY